MKKKRKSKEIPLLNEGFSKQDSYCSSEFEMKMRGGKGVKLLKKFLKASLIIEEFFVLFFFSPHTHPPTPHSTLAFFYLYTLETF